MAYWEIELSRSDGRYDLLRDGGVAQLSLDADEVRRFFQDRDIDLDEVEGSEMLR